MTAPERPYLSRGAGGAPTKCPVCWGPVRALGSTGGTTCRDAGPDHFEWRPAAARVLHVEGCPAMADTSLTSCSCAVEPQVLGVDWLAATASRLGGNAGRLAAIHKPSRDYYGLAECDGCDPGAHAESAASWPCETATLALEMMGLTEKDITVGKG